MKLVLVGSYTDLKPQHYTELADGKGLYIYGVQQDTNGYPKGLKLLNLLEGWNPIYFTLSDDKKFLYVGNEGDKPHQNAISVYKTVDLAKGQFELVSKVPVRGRWCCFVSQFEDYILAANYKSGSAIGFQSDGRGNLKEIWFDQYTGGKNLVPTRQECAKAHCTVVHPKTRQVYVADLGNDCLYQYDLVKNGLKPTEKQPKIEFKDAAGPRTVEVHQSGKFVYAACELENTVAPFKVSADRTLSLIHPPISTLSDIEKDHYIFTEVYQCLSDLKLTPDGKFLYVSNRGIKNSLAIFEVNQETGALTSVGHQSTFGAIPRNFDIDPSGDWLMVANQDSDSLVPFKIDKKSGKLHHLGAKFESKVPVCVLIVDA